MFAIDETIPENQWDERFNKLEAIMKNYKPKD